MYQSVTASLPSVSAHSLMMLLSTTSSRVESESVHKQVVGSKMKAWREVYANAASRWRGHRG
eukprot:m.239299 g.239299  ORF g.239299 m.239299 type:complete len:62 (-) comp48951_c0_seq1:46-231(-)